MARAGLFCQWAHTTTKQRAKLQEHGGASMCGNSPYARRDSAAKDMQKRVSWEKKKAMRRSKPAACGDSEGEMGGAWGRGGLLAG